MTVDFRFLNVGHGDCTIVYFPERKRKDGKIKSERVMVIDCHQNNNDDNYTNLIEYYKDNFRNADGSLKSIFRFVCTHPHQDHIYGLSELLKDDEIKITNFWDLNHSFIPENFDHYPTHKDDWKAYKKLGGDDSPATVISAKRESRKMLFWNDDEDRISILSPSNKLKKYAHYKEDGSERESSNVEIDEMSYTLLIQINERKVILASDGRCSPCWNDIYDNCITEIADIQILKAGHHGQECSFHEDAVKVMDPAIIVFSNSKEQDKDNGAGKSYNKITSDTIILKTWRDGNILIQVPFDLQKPMEYYLNN